MLEQGVADLGLANNTMDEAFSTLSGSLAMAKGAWSNLVTGLANDSADLDTLINNFVDSVVAASRNIIPTIGKALGGIGKLIEEVVPVALEYIPQIITEFLPSVAESAAGIVTSIGTAIFDNIDQIIAYGQNILDALLDGIISNAGNISASVTEIVTKFGTFIIENLPEIVTSGIDILISLVKGIVGALPQLSEAAIKAVAELAAYIVSAENLEKILLLGVDLISALSEGLGRALGALVSIGEDIVESIKSGISAAWDGLKTWFNNLWDSLFGSRSVNVNVNASSSGVNGSHAGGLSYVPFDGYVAELHRGERVLTANEAREYRHDEKQKSGGVTVVQNIYSQAKTAADLMQEALYQQERAVLLGV